MHVSAHDEPDLAVRAHELVPHHRRRRATGPLGVGVARGRQVEEGVGREDRRAVRVGGQHAVGPVQRVGRGLELEREHEPVHAARGEQGVVVHVAAVHGVGAELVLAQVAAVGGGRRRPRGVRVAARREPGVVLRVYAGGGREVVVTRQHAVGHVVPVEDLQPRGDVSPVRVPVIADEVTEVGHELGVQLRAGVGDPLSLSVDDPVAGEVGVVLRVRDDDEREGVGRRGTGDGRSAAAPLEPNGDVAAVGVCRGDREHGIDLRRGRAVGGSHERRRAGRCRACRDRGGSGEHRRGRDDTGQDPSCPASHLP